jgi:diketogulonate reductase-like aldo/keto reductase
MSGRALAINGVQVPRFLYGTAWKEDETERLTVSAVRAGFRGIDTANQRKHYHEAAVGKAIAAVIRDGSIARDELFLQTKFTFERGQDHRLPYDLRAAVSTQVSQSFESSMEHLGLSAIDSYVLHGPSQAEGLAAADREAWRAMEALHEGGKVRMLGVSNVTAGQLRLLCEMAKIRPSFVQNRCYATRGWDSEVQAVAAEHGITYQGFSLLTANRQILSHPELRRIAERHGRNPAQIVFRFALHLGMIPLTGTTNAEHMRDDLAVFDFALDPDEVRRIENLATP